MDATRDWLILGKLRAPTIVDDHQLQSADFIAAGAEPFEPWCSREELEAEVEHLRAVTGNWLGELKNYQALLIKEAKRSESAIGRPPKLKNQLSPRGARQRRQTAREDPDRELKQLIDRIKKMHAAGSKRH